MKYYTVIHIILYNDKYTLCIRFNLDLGEVKKEKEMDKVSVYLLQETRSFVCGVAEWTPPAVLVVHSGRHRDRRNSPQASLAFPHFWLQPVEGGTFDSIFSQALIRLVTILATGSSMSAVGWMCTCKSSSAFVVFQSDQGLSCAMLAVYLDNASNLPVSGPWLLTGNLVMWRWSKEVKLMCLSAETQRAHRESETWEAREGRPGKMLTRLYSPKGNCFGLKLGYGSQCCLDFDTCQTLPCVFVPHTEPTLIQVLMFNILEW